MIFFIKILKCLGLLILGFLLLTTVEVLALRWLPVPRTILMTMRNKEFKADKNYQFRQNWVSLPAISPNVVKAVIASEDNLFYRHKGFDWKEINTAMEQNKKGKRLRGASTITQQVAKNVFLWPDRSWLRKGLEAYYTVLIEFLWSKERIMEVYLNVIEMGDGIYGCEMAAQIYFNKSAKNLTLHQAALITVCYPNPRKWNPSKPTPYITKRSFQIAHLTTLIGKISFEEENIKKARERYKKKLEKKG